MTNNLLHRILNTATVWTCGLMLFIVTFCSLPLDLLLRAIAVLAGAAALQIALFIRSLESGDYVLHIEEKDEEDHDCA